MKYNSALVACCDDDDDGEDEEDDEDEEVHASLERHSDKPNIPTRQHVPEKMEEAWQMILQRNSCSVSQKSNVVIDSICNVCIYMVNKAKQLKGRLSPGRLPAFHVSRPEARTNFNDKGIRLRVYNAPTNQMGMRSCLIRLFYCSCSLSLFASI